MCAAVVLGFLLVGLNILQKGNREAVLRIRARDAASNVSQYIIDSIAKHGLKGITKDPDNCSDPSKECLVYYNPEYAYYFEGKNTGKVKTDFTVEAFLHPNTADDPGASPPNTAIDSTYFTRAQRTDKNTPSPSEKNEYLQNLEVIVSWNFKNSIQSIRMTKAVK